MQDISFENHIDRFRRKIDDSYKGRIRQAVIGLYLKQYLPVLHEQKGLRVADVGGGFGRFAVKAAGGGHTVHYCDLSPKMTKEAVAYARREGVADRIHFLTGSFQELLAGEQFDVVNCQAVLEWLHDPMQGLDCLMKAVVPGGHLILVFYNRQSVVLRNLIRGNFYKVDSDDYRGDGKGLTPINPLHPEKVLQRLLGSGFHVVGKAGLRTFSDFCFPHVDIAERIDDVIRLETKLAAEEPFLSIARYMLVVAERPSP